MTRGHLVPCRRCRTPLLVGGALPRSIAAIADARCPRCTLATRALIVLTIMLGGMLFVLSTLWSAA